MKKGLLFLGALILLCGLTVSSANAAEPSREVKTVTVDDTVVTITNFLRVETRSFGWEDPSWYDTAREVTIYVVSDEGSQVTVAAQPEYPYFDGNLRWDEVGERRYALYVTERRVWNEERNIFAIQEEDRRVAMSGPLTFEIRPFGDDPITLLSETGVYVLCESDFARLTPARKDIQASYWASMQIEDLYYNGLLKDVIDPFVKSCKRDMTRGELLPLVINLYESMSGEQAVSKEVPFTDLEEMSTAQREALGKAYGLGLINGISPTSFAPMALLTIEQAIAVFGRLAEKLGWMISEPVEENLPWLDTDEIHRWAKAEAAFLDQKGILPWWPWRTEGYLHPQAPISMENVFRIACFFKQTPYWPILESGSLSELSFDELDVTQRPGVGINIVYESQKQVIFYGYFGLFGYDLEKECLTFGIDFLKTFGQWGSVQGEEGTGVGVSRDGTRIILTDPAIEMAYYIDISSMTFRAGEPQTMEDAFSWDQITGEIFCSYNIETCRYIRDEKEWYIFQYPLTIKSN